MRSLTLFIVVALFALCSEAKREHKEELSISLTPGRRNGLINDFLDYHYKYLYNPNTNHWFQFAVLCIVPETGNYDYNQLYNLYLCEYARPDPTDRSIHAEDNVFKYLPTMLNRFNNNFKGQKFDILLYTYLLPCGRCKDTIVNQVVGKGASEIAVVYSVIYPFDVTAGNRNLQAVKTLFASNGIRLTQYTP